MGGVLGVKKVEVFESGEKGPPASSKLSANLDPKPFDASVTC